MSPATLTSSFPAKASEHPLSIIGMDLMAPGADTVFRLDEERADFVAAAKQKPVATALGFLKRVIVALNARTHDPDVTSDPCQVSGGYDGTNSNTRQAIHVFVDDRCVTMEEIRYYIAQGAPDQFGAYSTHFPNDSYGEEIFGLKSLDDRFLEELAIFFPQGVPQNVEPVLEEINRPEPHQPEPHQ